MYDVMGGRVNKPDPETMRRVLDGLAEADAEHPDVSLTHERVVPQRVPQWPVALGEPGRRSRAPREMHEVAREEILRLFGLLAAGDIASVEALPWQNPARPRSLAG